MSSAPPDGEVGNTPSPDPAQRRREQRGWYVYDWANQVFITSVVTVLIGPYLSGLACDAAGASDGDACLDPSVRIHPLGVDWISLHPNALHPTLTTGVVLILVLLLPLVGALADHTRHKKRWLFWLAAGGSVAVSSLYLTDDYRLTSLLFVIGNVCYGLSIVVFNAFLPEIATAEERNRVSVTGWSLAYLGGAVLLTFHLGLVTFAPDIGIGDAEAVRIAFASVGVWWLGFSVLGIRPLRNRYGKLAQQPGRPKVGASLKQFARTVRDMRNYPNTLLFLVAFIFFNDGIQAAIYFAGNFATQDLGLSLTVLSATILMIQFVAFAGALLMGRISRVVGTKNTVLVSLVIWCALVTAGYFLPPGEPLLFVLLGLGIGTVLGGTQSLARALYSLLIPRGREAEYFSLYQLADRGSTLLGSATIALVVNLTGGYRTAIFSLLIFFVIGAVLLWRTNLKAGIEAVGNTVPRHL
ncbi:MFS transporter [Nocardiopsis sp. HNM0947]|uniref:MFS transporter n=1 Tax=Nocardiopsis coralli TaxID=2772213 RepID=A0ABR9P109_9ACTN|nr:MFS transporter [Nocardiopsis coralli]MBE2997497.1 MFS transporter [Nocardiopsis coralli]